ncbi:MAG: Na/Pi cotransporter family protein [Faecousia sp.]
MDIFSVITLIGGLAFFLYGMHVMSSGLERMAGGKLEHALKRMTSNPLKSLALGAGITVAVQSSSAVTVMLVGLVNSGLMNIAQTPGVIMGSNIGTTLTAWLLSLVGLETDNVWLKLLKPENFSLIFAMVGAVLIMISKKPKRRDIGSILVGFAVLMYGMKFMSSAVSPLADMPEFASLLTAFRNPLLGVLVGALFTGIIQSSAASVGILQALALTGNISYGMAIPIIMGQNIGTCVTALISSIGVKRNAKKVAAIHVSFNLIGTVFFLALFYGLDALVHFSFTDMPIGAFEIAVVHSIFNVATTILLLPFSKQLVKIANLVVRDKKGKEEPPAKRLDERLLATPSVAVGESNAMTVDMMKTAHRTLLQALALIEHYDEKTAEEILEQENRLDACEDELGTYLVRLASNKLSAEDSMLVSKMLHTIGDFERLGDHAVNILGSVRELQEKKLSFSPAGKEDLALLSSALTEILSLTAEAYEKNDAEIASRVEPLEQTIDGLVERIKDKHVTRLQNGECTIQLGFILADLLNNFERVSDHCSNIAVSVIEIKHNTFDTHQYLNRVKYGSREFTAQYEEYCEKYGLK